MTINDNLTRQAKKLASLCMISALAACSYSDRLHRTEIKGNDFKHELAKEYKTLSEAEAKQNDWKSANHFAKKGLWALGGKNVEPEKVDHWKEPSNHRHELIQARHLLEEILTTRLKEDQPAHTARAQTLYDCWVEQQSENWQTNDIAFCKHGFYHIVEQLKRGGHHFYEQKHKMPHKEVAPVEQKQEHSHHKPHALTHTVYFAHNSSMLTEKAKEVLHEIVRFVHEHKGEKMTLKLHLSGYADTTGGDNINMKISADRDKAVKAFFKEKGLDSAQISTVAYGKTHLAVPTPDQTKEPLNRRVEIHIHQE